MTGIWERAGLVTILCCNGPEGDGKNEQNSGKRTENAIIFSFYYNDFYPFMDEFHHN